MKKWHRIGFNPRESPGLRGAIEHLDIEYQTLPLPGYEIGLIYFDITESDPRWKELNKLFQKWPVSDVFDTIFDEEEVLAAEWLRLVPVYEKGYLKPGNSKWREYLYEGYCEGCGAYERQKTPIQMTREPKRPEQHVLTPIGPYVVLCSPNMEKGLKEADIRGYEVWPVLHHKTGKPFENTTQLYIPQVAKPGLTKTEDLEWTACPVCGRIKYQPHMRGVMYFKREAFAESEGIDILHSYEWFGSGHAAYREFLISNKFARFILERGWKGMRLKVVELI